MREWRAIFVHSLDGFSELLKRGELKSQFFDGFGYAAGDGGVSIGALMLVGIPISVPPCQ